MYAAVSLAPKVLEWATLTQEEYRIQLRLVTLERQVTYLGRVVDALENEPDFAEQLARMDFDARRPGDERISVAPSLTLDARDVQPPPDPTPRHVSLLIPLARQLTERAELRRAMLTGAAALLVFAFTFLNEAPPQEKTSDKRAWQDFFARRYLNGP